MVWLRLIWWIVRRGLVWGIIEGLIFGTIMFPIFGTIIGAVVGPFICGVVGCINGLILTGIIRFRYYDPERTQIKTEVIYEVAFWSNIIFTFLVIVAIGLIIAVKPLGSQVPIILIFGGSIPASVEGARAARFSRRFVDFANTEFSKLASRQPPANMLSLGEN